MKNVIYLSIVLFSVRTFSQPVFSLVDANKMILDPAFTAIDTEYKHEASVYGKTYVTNTPFYQTDKSCIATYQMRLDKLHSGVGIMFNDNYLYYPDWWVYNQIAAKLYYRYTILPGLSIGADAGFVNLKSNEQFGILEFNGPNITYFQETLTNLSFDGGIGILYQFKSLYAGFSVDHMNKPQATYLNYNYYTYSVDGTISYPMPNYNGVAYNWIIGGYLPFNKESGLDLSASYRSDYADINATLEVPHFFLGISTLLYADGNNRLFGENNFYPENSITYALIAGLKAYHNKIKVSFAFNYYVPSKYYTAFSIIPLEGAVSYSF